MSEDVLCEVCCRAYGRKAAEAPLPANAAGLAAVLTGWECKPGGYWNCGAAACKSVGKRVAMKREPG